METPTPTPTPHKHKALTDIYYAAPEWWDVYVSSAPGVWRRAMEPGWVADLDYKLEKSAKHPDNIKPEKRLIDWAKMPRGTMTNGGVFLSIYRHYAKILQNNDYLVRILLSELRLAEQTEFTYWGGGECPVPEGVVVEIVLRQWNAPREYASPGKVGWSHDNFDGDIIAYRITGLADGWTDVPEEAV